MSDRALSLDIEAPFGALTLRLAERLPLAGTLAVFGPSGAGKTSLLRLIAGLERPARGTIRFGDTVWADEQTFVPAHKRGVGYMFQTARLFSHLSVRGNLRFAEKRAPGPGQYTVADLVDAFDLRLLLDRDPATLSGGERQRVALARTLASQPDLLLLDEPLSALDEARKRDILPFLEDLPARFGVPTLIVTHDIDEVARLADSMLVLNDGAVSARGDVETVVNGHGLEPMTGRYETSTLLTTRVSHHDPRLSATYVDLGGARLSLPLAEKLAIGADLRIRIRARDVAIATARPEGLSIQNMLAGTVSQIEDDGAGAVRADIRLESGDLLSARITRAAVEALELTPGLSVFALIKSVSFDGRFA
ncbi:MAG: molybdenum ABC transporter ATP-binding protein [Pseudomonadota bacterium]